MTSRAVFLRSASAPLTLVSLTAVSTALAVAGCTTTDTMSLPDVVIFLDGGTWDSGIDGGLPDPVIDTCMDPGGTIGNACGDPSECDDGCFCNGVETCTGGVCAAGSDPCENEVGPDGTPMDIACTDEACLEETDACFHMPNHAMCSDGAACNGYEQCDRRLGCVEAAPLYCNDETSCTVDSCDDTMGCVYTPRDLDADGYRAGSCGGDDCDDDPRYGTMIHPGADEVCDNRRDDDCDGRRDYSDSDCVPTNDACDTATVIPAVSGTYSGSTSGLTRTYTLACSTSTGPDAVFRFTLTEPHDVRVSVGGISNAAIALRTFAQCATGPELKCNGSTSTTAPSVLARSLPAGEYAIIVRTATAGVFDLQMMITDPTVAPAVDQCNTGTVAITASGTYTGRFEETSDDYSLTCHSGTGWRDAVYRLELAADSDVDISASTTGGGQTYVAISTDCSMPTSTLTCSTGSTALIHRRGMPAGTYYILVESSLATAPEWSLNVTITTPPAPRQAGDACSTAIPITLSGATDPLTGTGMAMLTGAENDGGTSCGGSTTGNRDVYFAFTLPETRDVTITTSAASAFHYVSLQGTCGVTGSELRCRSATSPYTTPYSQIFLSLPAGTYYIAVATAASAGTVTATVESRPPTPIPPNDRCSGAIALVNGDFRYDTLIGFEDDATGAVGSGYPDAFYTFTLTERRRVTIIASATVGTPAVYQTLRSSCATTTNLASATGATGTSTLVTTLDPGTYVFFVEMTPAAATNFSMDFRTMLPPP